MTKQQLLRMAEFDEATNGKALCSAAEASKLEYFTPQTEWTIWGDNQECYEHGFYGGARHERDRLMPLITALVESCEEMTMALKASASLSLGANRDRTTWFEALAKDALASHDARMNGLNTKKESK